MNWLRRLFQKFSGGSMSPEQWNAQRDREVEQVRVRALFRRRLRLLTPEDAETFRQLREVRQSTVVPFKREKAQ